MTPHGDGPPPAPPPIAHGHELGFDLPAARDDLETRAWSPLAVGAALVLGAAFAVGYLPRHRERAALDEATQSAGSRPLRVDVIAAEGRIERSRRAPAGQRAAAEETVLYARASGFVRRWLVDMGDKVAAGQLLAEIETPELDQELDQARAQLGQAQAVAPALEGQPRARRTRTCSATSSSTPVGVASQADLDQRQAQAQVDEANVSVAQATIAAQEANIRRLTQLKAFARVTAPFAGTVTQRWVEVGALVTAGNGQPLYRIAATDPARVFVQVPQDVAPGVRVGRRPRRSRVREYPGAQVRRKGRAQRRRARRRRRGR